MKLEKMHSPEWFQEAFKADTPVPEPLKKVSERICRTFGIRGICDPLYIANTVAYELGAGDGKSQFTKMPLRVASEKLVKLTGFLIHAYWINIGGTATEQLKAILDEELGVPSNGGPVWR